MVEISRPNVPVVLENDEEHRRLLADAINQMLLGRLNNIGDVTLDANQASTAVTDQKVATQSKILLFPTSASAATEFASGNLYISAVTAESFTVAHTNNAVADRDFAYIILG